ncbi:OLC1v1031797C1 [Oldenlandia corymbosa var. corymbosa]|uniref:O-fucosyltransferase family protein n=1 Tax=Oldenlandia corymbosa var. corymbosa TaxID=529605 RepID=A0AAV1CK32_OLDCO|nr:OLC1v1031797C1 [Oldenlandia corymbosa var. corymbosa]
MGVANKAGKYNGGVLVKNLTLFYDFDKNPNLSSNGVSDDKEKQKPTIVEQHWFSWKWWRPWLNSNTTTTGRKPKISWSVKVCGVLLFAVGLISLFTGHLASDLEWYSQRLVKRTLYYKLTGNTRPEVDIWKSKYSSFYFGCSERGRDFTPAVRQRSSNGYLLIATSGGLNQQRTGITDAVVVARILNATLVVPELDHHSFWKDDSDFLNIFDVDWFISYLAKDVPIVKRVPEKVMRSMDKPPYTMRVPRKSEPEYYLDQVLPILLRRRVVQLTKFDYRLANDLDDELQKLRCRVNYHALRFIKPIRNLGQKLVTRMRKMAKRYIAVHLRFEPDMLAFSGCYYGGGDKERYELGEIRKRWETLPEMSPDEERSRGKCPLTPHEVGLMLRALGFTNDTYLYVASGEIYGGEETLRPLRELFPNFYTKDMLASEELKPFLPFSSRLAALDYIVCDESDVFITNNNGNMAKILAGRRRYMGHKRTIRPNAKRLSALFMAREKMAWDTFAKKVKSCQRGFMGEPDEIKPGRGEFHEYPSACICQKPFHRTNTTENDDEDQPLEATNNTNALAKPRYAFIRNNQSENEVTKTLKAKGPGSLADETDHDNFLSD